MKGTGTPIATLAPTLAVTHDQATVPPDAWTAVGVCAIAIAILAYRRIAAELRAADADKEPGILEVSGVLIAAIGMLGAITRTLAVPVDAKSAWTPNLDAITLAWAGAAALGLLIPLVTEITVGSVSLKLTKIGAQLLDETSKVLRDWSAVLNVYVADAHSTTDGKWPQRLEQFVLWRLSEASEWVGTPEDAPLQLSVWLANSTTRQLEFSYGLGFEANPTEKIGFEEGVIGAAFTEHISRNEIEPDAFPSRMFKKLDSRPYCGKSLMVIPIDYGSQQLGVVVISRSRREYFDDKTINVMKSLAHVLGSAIGEAERVFADTTSGSAS